MTQEMVPLVMDSRYIPKRRIDSALLSSQCGRGYYPKQFQGFKPRDMMNCNDITQEKASQEEEHVWGGITATIKVMSFPLMRTCFLLYTIVDTAYILSNLCSNSVLLFHFNYCER